MCLQFTISLKFLQQNILETSLTVKVIVFIIFSIKKIVFLKNIYVRKHSRMRQIAPFSFRENMPPNPLAMCSLKNDTPMTCLNMKLRSCPRVRYELDISVQAMRLALLFC